MFNASIIYFVIPFMSQAFYSPLLSTLSSLLPFFSLYPRPINFPFYLSSFYSFILYRHSITESKEGRENSTYMKKKIVSLLRIFIAFSTWMRLKRILNLKLAFFFSGIHGTKKLVSEEILISNSQTKAYLL